MEQPNYSIQACFANARNLLRAARCVLDDEKLSNIAFHLTLLALEEVGKATLFPTKNAPDEYGDFAPILVPKEIGDVTFGEHLRHLAEHAGTIPARLDEFGRCLHCVRRGLVQAGRLVRSTRAMNREGCELAYLRDGFCESRHSKDSKP
jgi:hypothetical protein